MSTSIEIPPHASKRERYHSLLPQLHALISGEEDLIANLANISSALKYAMDFFWVGFYQVKDDELVLGPFQGPVACTRIKKGKGVCGQAWLKKETLLVDDVDQFPGHIACSSESKSEIVVPVFDQNQEVFLILDVDSSQLSAFDDTDRHFLGEVAKLIENKVAA